jgi:hypothetical protein
MRAQAAYAGCALIASMLLSRQYGRTSASISRSKPEAPLYRGEPPDRFLTRIDQKPDVGSHGGLVQGAVANAPTRGARTQAASEVAV